MSVGLYAIGAVLIVSLISLIGIFTISIRPKLLQKGLFILVSLAVGALLGDAIVHLIPESLHEIDNAALAGAYIIGGFLTFFILEKFLHWHHFHGTEELEHEAVNAQSHVHPMGQLVLVSDGLHNLIDGIIIGASFLVSVEVGIATTIAIILHEIPQEIGDFGVLLHAGYSKFHALMVNFASALAAVFGAIIALAAHASAETFVPFMTAFAAGSFLYIAGSDLVPELHKTTHPGHSFAQFAAITIGIGLMFLLLLVEVPH